MPDVTADPRAMLTPPPELLAGLMGTGFGSGTAPLTPDDKSNMLMKLGLSLMQPVAPGQTPIGAFAGRASGAIDQAASLAAGHKAQALQSLGIAANLMKSGADTRTTNLTGDTAAARLPYAGPDAAADVAGKEKRNVGQDISNTLGAGTLQAHMDRAKADADTAVIAAHRAQEGADSAIALDKIEADIKMKRAKIEKDVPDAAIRKSVLAEYDKASATVAKLRAEASEAGAKAGLYSAEHSKLTKELDGLKDASPEELKQYFSKSGKYSASKSALDNQATLWGNLYDKLPANDPSKGGKTREQFQMDQLTQSKRKDAVEMLVKAKQAGMSDEDINDLGLMDMAKEASAERRRATGGGDAGEADIKAAALKQGIDYDPKKYEYRLQGGKLQRKLKGS